MHAFMISSLSLSTPEAEKQRNNSIQKSLSESFQISHFNNLGNISVKKSIKNYRILSHNKIPIVNKILSFVAIISFFKKTINLKPKLILIVRCGKISLLGLFVSKLRNIPIAIDYPSSSFFENPILLQFSKSVYYRKTWIKSSYPINMHWIFNNFIDKIIIKNSKWIISPSERFSQYLLEERGADKQTILLLPNSVDANRFYPQKKNSKLRKKLGISRSSFIVVFSCSPTWSMNIVALESFLEEAVSFFSEETQISFLIIGPESEKYEKYTDKFIFTGLIPFKDMVRYINLADVCISPYPDGYESPNHLKNAEYMACGKPIIGTKNGLVGYENTIRKKINQRQENNLGICKAISNLILDFKQLKKRSLESRKFAIENLVWKVNTKKILDSIKSDISLT